ncbi:acetylornithine transaminase [Terrihalobacillus insolitus]|uniref:acetylornithine transaminase n=1 Tax=Terrihalobacillus insolitus TaxID=2950438 RepID=UPI002341F6D4|nr:acetylornithine transaminase [Terrihalobacillus insolitus]MDC3414375.1 acetylornithine transaminase [Terrihalobacillus insolitus]
MMNQAIMPTYNRFPVTLVKGSGSYVWDEFGNEFLDYTSGIATCNLGHVPDIVKVEVEKQLQQLWHCSNLYHIPSQEKLASALAEHSFGDQAFFCNSGAEANEAAIKLARKYAQTVKGTDKYEIVSFQHSFHGRTLATLTATGQEKVKEGFSPLPAGFRHLPYNDMELLDELIQPETCAVMLELVQGEGGVNPADPEWVNQLVKMCRDNDVLIIIDEIQTGMGRTGTLFAYEGYGFEPDIMTVAKGLGSGFPIGAVIANEQVAEAFGPGSHGSTFGGNPIVTSAGLATLTHITNSSILTEAKQASAYLIEQLFALKEQFDTIETIRGKGLLQGIVVKEEAATIVAKLRDQHILVLLAGPSVIRILPPLTTTKEEIDQFITALKSVFQTS